MLVNFNLSMTRMKTNVLLIVLVALFFCIPFLPSQVLMLTDLLLVRLVLLAAFVAAMQVSPIAGILALAVIALLFIERNKRKMKYLQQAMQLSTPESPAIESIQTPETAPPQPEFETPSTNTIYFAPQEETGENIFKPVDKTINQKQVLPTQSTDGSQKVVNQLFEWVNPNLVQM